MKKNATHRIALTAILSAQALALGFIENLVPPSPFLPPGAKLGLSNIITMFAAKYVGFADAVFIAFIKGCFAFVSRGFTAGVMSMSGGLLSAAATCALARFAGERLGWIGVSVICALCHNFGQLAAAAFLTGTTNLVFYAPALAVFGTAAGIVTGITLKIVAPALNKMKRYLFNPKS